MYRAALVTSYIEYDLQNETIRTQNFLFYILVGVNERQKIAFTLRGRLFHILVIAGTLKESHIKMMALKLQFVVLFIRCTDMMMWFWLDCSSHCQK